LPCVICKDSPSVVRTGRCSATQPRRGLLTSTSRCPRLDLIGVVTIAGSSLAGVTLQWAENMKTITLVTLLAGLGLGLVPFEVAAQEHNSAPPQPTTKLIPSVEGPDLFRAHCAVCHGTDGRGNGPAAAALKVKPADLTLISVRNGGKFPADRVSHIIAGDDKIIPHGSREMPIWGPIFHEVQRDQDWGEVRMHNLQQYLLSIQRKP
jgi:mono/diheme cytochrome c family protein